MTLKIPTAEKMNKYPWAVTSVSLFSVCVFLLILLLDKPDCEDEVKRLRFENTQYRSDKDALTNALLISRGINIQQAIEKKEMDSTIRQKLATKANKVIGGK
ncbi:hypothetical protein N180_02700 [Pedobacter antarcticus 4BY]|uniref:Uncharacterized protein n=2 Tax=Pedobacter antarcticus TaxID=34086 RepID=A0A081PKF1_9SPHI|nr:hypothetical protein [Pedobacter antarcticus]KEQ31174.1 hypothetical protein N180_02700 [Pedobacter antarcticus 4BY]SFE54050.1 hypothetical protein SAMN03003324_00830 [Pedobacter antarcticus]